jgi:alanine racemase
MDAPAQAQVDLAAVRDNVTALREHVSGAGVMAVVKSDAYGHGLIPVATAALAGGAGWLGVIRVDEALALRGAGLTAPMLCLMSVPGGPHENAIRHDVDLGVSSAGMVAEIAAAAQRAGRPARVHLKVDTGMSRGGATMADWPAVVAAALAAQAAGQVQVVGLWSHLACADMPGHQSIDAQITVFHEAIALAEKAGVEPEVRHLANTPATLTLPHAWFDLVRCGGGVVGLPTLPGPMPAWLRPAMTVRARLVQVKEVPTGAGVSYGHRYVTSSPSTLGLVPLGYAEGVPRDASGLVQVYARGRRWFISGTVSMNQFVLDFGAEPAVEGDEVLLFGPGDSGEPTAQDWADAVGTISYEIATSFGGRIPRSYLGVAYADDPVDAGAAAKGTGEAPGAE